MADPESRHAVRVANVLFARYRLRIEVVDNEITGFIGWKRRGYRTWWKLRKGLYRIPVAALVREIERAWGML